MHARFFCGVLSTLLTFLSVSTIAQGQYAQVGDTLPDALFQNVLYYSKPELRLSDFRGKLVILDFWGPRCISCLESFPRVDSLQKKFKDKLQIIMVNQEGNQETANFFATRKQIHPPAVPFITGDSLLWKLFPRISVALQAWISKEGKIIFITQSYETTAQHIADFLNDKRIDLAPFKGVDYATSLFDAKSLEQLEYFSYLSHWNYMNFTGPANPEGINLAVEHSSAVDLYIQAFNEGLTFDFRRPQRLVLEIEDSLRYLKPKSGDLLRYWLANYSYSYQLMLPKSKKGEQYKIMQQDLGRYFNLEARVEKRLIKCFALVRTSSKDKLQTKGGKRMNFEAIGLRTQKLDSFRTVTNTSFEGFASSLQYYIESNLDLPFENLVHYTGNIDISIKGEALDAVSKFRSRNLNGLRKELQKYDLDIVRKDCLIDVLIIKDKTSLVKK